jgi:hypothetical protein
MRGLLPRRAQRDAQTMETDWLRIASKGIMVALIFAIILPLDVNSLALVIVWCVDVVIGCILAW